MNAQELQDYILRTHNKPMTEMGFIELHMALEDLNRTLLESYHEKELIEYEEKQKRLEEEADEKNLHESLLL